MEIVTKKLTEILDMLAPVKTLQTRTNYAPWLSGATKEKIKQRNEAQIKAARTKKQSDWEEYKKQRNRINNIVKSEKRIWQESKISHFGTDSRSIWKNLRKWLGWSKGGPPTKLVEGGTVYTKPSDLARIMNTFFITKVIRSALSEKL